MLIKQQLNLTVGNDGVIGRRVSVYSDESMQTILSEGVIGWN
jgi:hypothetical protein